MVDEPSDGIPLRQHFLFLFAAAALLAGALMPVGLILAPAAKGEGIPWVALLCLAVALGVSWVVVFGLRKVVEESDGPVTDPLVRVATCGHAFAVMLLAGVLAVQMLGRVGTTETGDLPDLGWGSKIGLLVGVLVLFAARIHSLPHVYDSPILLYLGVVAGWACERFGWAEATLAVSVFVLIGCVFHFLRLFNFAGGVVAIALAVLSGPCIAAYLLLSSGRPFDFHELYWACLFAYAVVGLVGGAVGFPAFFAARLWQYGECVGVAARVIAGAILAGTAVAVLYAVFMAGSLFTVADAAKETPVAAFTRFEQAINSLTTAISWTTVAAPAAAGIAAATLFVSVWWGGTRRAPLWVPLSVRFARRGEPAKAVARLTRLLDSSNDAEVAAAAAALGEIGLPATPALQKLNELAECTSRGEWRSGVWYDRHHPSIHAKVAVHRIAELTPPEPVQTPTASARTVTTAATPTDTTPEASGPSVLEIILAGTDENSEAYPATVFVLAERSPTHPAVVAAYMKALGQDHNYARSGRLDGKEAIDHLRTHNLLTVESLPSLKSALGTHRRQPYLLEAIGSLGSAAASLVPELLELKVDPGDQHRADIDAALERIGPVEGKVREEVIADFAGSLTEEATACDILPSVRRILSEPLRPPCGRCVICVYVEYLQRFGKSSQDAIPRLVDRLMMSKLLESMRTDRPRVTMGLIRLRVPTEPAVVEAVLHKFTIHTPESAVAAREMFSDPGGYSEEQYELLLQKLTPDNKEEEDDDDDDDDYYRDDPMGVRRY